LSEYKVKVLSVGEYRAMGVEREDQWNVRIIFKSVNFVVQGGSFTLLWMGHRFGGQSLG
jgi:hypothetical protein